jgi:hypothetical protein
MSKGSVLRTENDGLVNEHHDPRINRIFGRFWFDWHEDAARRMVFKDAITYEAGVLRKFIITGFQHVRGRKSSISTIGTAPDSSPNSSDIALDSERTTSVTQSSSVDPSPASQQTLSFVTIDDLTSSFRRSGHDSDLPSTTRGGRSHGNITNQLPDTPTRPPRVSVGPYRPPHTRTASGTGTACDQGNTWRMPHSQQHPRPGYYAPHPTAHNLRSSSDSFAPLPPVTQPSQRSRSDATRNMFEPLQEAESQTGND